MAERKRKMKLSDDELQVITDDRGSSKVQEQHRTVSERNRIWDGSFQSVLKAPLQTVRDEDGVNLLKYYYCYYKRYLLG